MKVLIVEDNKALARVLDSTFAAESSIYRKSVDDLVQALIVAKNLQPTLIVLDLGLPNSTPDNTIKHGIPELARVAPDAAIMVHTGMLNENRAAELEKAGVHAVLEKPSDKVSFLRASMDALRKKNDSYKPYIKLLEGILGTSL